MLLLWTPEFAAHGLCEDEVDCDDNMAEDGDGGKLYIDMLSNISFKNLAQIKYND